MNVSAECFIYFSTLIDLLEIRKAASDDVSIVNQQFRAKHQQNGAALKVLPPVGPISSVSQLSANQTNWQQLTHMRLILLPWTMDQMT